MKQERTFAGEVYYSFVRKSFLAINTALLPAILTYFTPISQDEGENESEVSAFSIKRWDVRSS